MKLWKVGLYVFAYCNLFIRIVTPEKVRIGRSTNVDILLRYTKSIRKFYDGLQGQIVNPCNRGSFNNKPVIEGSVR